LHLNEAGTVLQHANESLYMLSHFGDTTPRPGF
jgi:hypothetical protein